jgi:hypothetical protein
MGELRHGQHAALVALCVTALAAFSGGVGIFPLESQRFWGIVCLLGLLLMVSRGGLFRFSLLIPATALLALVLLVREPAVWVLVVAGMLWIVGLQWDRTSLGCTALTLAAGSTLFAVLFLLYRFVPEVWLFTNDSLVDLSTVVGRRIGVGTVLGPTAAGFWVFLALFAVGCAYLANGSDPLDRILSVLFILYLALAFLLMMAWGAGVMDWLEETFKGAFADHPGVAGRGVDKALLGLHAPMLLLVAGLGIGSWLLPKTYPRPKTAGRGLGPAIGAALCGGALLATLGSPVTTATPGGRVLFYNNGMLDWRVPKAGAYGIQRGGMFGLLPKYLAAAGLETQRLARRDAITPQVLQEVDVLVVINPTESLQPAEREAIWQFVSTGGGLLVRGDHPDLGGRMQPLNDLLEPVGIAFRFDSAFSVRHWVGDYETYPHPTIVRLDSANEQLQQSTGASLALSSGAYPIVSGRFAFSDAGVRANEENGYLGDYRYQIGERLGDVVVVAGADYGRGRVIVFGDTSSFQNVAIYHSVPFIIDVFQYLAYGPTRTERVVGPVVAVIAVAMILWLLAHGGLRWTGLGAASLAMSVGFLFGTIAYIDAAHFNRFSLEHWQKDSIGGLTINLARNGLLPIILRKPVSDAIAAARLYVSIAPSKPFNEKEIAALERFMTRGGLVILSVGWEEKSGAKDLLELARFDVDSTPLGPVPVLRKTTDARLITAMQRQPHFMEAWPIVAMDAPDRVFFEAAGYPIMAFRSVGAGGLLLISDSQFLLDKTLEEENAWWEGNLVLLRRTLARLNSGAAQ